MSVSLLREGGLCYLPEVTQPVRERAKVLTQGSLLRVHALSPCALVESYRRMIAALTMTLFGW